MIVCLVLLAERPLRGLLYEDRSEELLNSSKFDKPLNLLELANEFERKKTETRGRAGPQERGKACPRHQNFYANIKAINNGCGILDNRSVSRVLFCLYLCLIVGTDREHLYLEGVVLPISSLLPRNATKNSVGLLGRLSR